MIISIHYYQLKTCYITITLATRLINSSDTLIDNIFIRSQIDDYIFGMIDKHSSDHRAIVCCYNSCMVRDISSRYIEIEESK